MRSQSVHPHTRGEHEIPSALNFSASGSSPHARGTRISYGRPGEAPRFIPTRAGNTNGEHLGARAAAVHPHTRGEHAPVGGGRGYSRGSSPHARGTHDPADRAPGRRRFIPTRAGNTFGAPHQMHPVAVHPHTRGEHAHSANSRSTVRGSSPHARGTLDRCHAPGFDRRFIPTRAGNTRAPAHMRMNRPVHPHTRGEHPLEVGASLSAFGSSPHARGTRMANAAGSASNRFIPTRAGNTARGRRGSAPGTVHPHTRGEHQISRRGTDRGQGSSPHARGTRAGGRGRSCRHRFIPTRAGNTRADRSPTRRRSVHPHTRGEHSSLRSALFARDGSSPHARGTPKYAPGNACHGRFIPTRAGNTPRRSDGRNPSAVHPHTRGEHLSHCGHFAIVSGSSPHARGTP